MIAVSRSGLTAYRLSIPLLRKMAVFRERWAGGSAPEA
jgi:hypothetical protein